MKKVAIVTGVTSGIGYAITEKLINQNMHVVGLARREELLIEMENKFSKSNFTPLKCDISDTDNLTLCINSILNNHDTIDALVCNAGITADNLIIRMKDQEWNSVINTNLTSVFKLNQIIVKHMIKKKAGSIVNIASIIGCTGNSGQANYAAAKAGIIAMSKSIALEVAARNIRINCIAPGFIQTAMTDKLNDAQQEQILDRVPMKRMGTAKEIADSTAFLISDAASYITGTTLHVNGGMYM